MRDVTYQFEEFRLSPARFQLMRHDKQLRMERKPLELLLLLAESDGRLVTRTEIATHLWGDQVFVDTEHGINTAVRKVRVALGETPEAPRFLQTVTGLGYRFLAPMEVVEAAADGVTKQTAGSSDAPASDMAAPAPVSSWFACRDRSSILRIGMMKRNARCSAR